MKRADLADHFIQSALHLIFALGIASFLNVSTAADFIDANWISMGGIPGANGPVNAAVVDGAGNLYIGGSFRVVGDVFANNIAKWNGTNWSALGSGMDSDVGSGNSYVLAVAVSGSNLYAGGQFTTAGGNAATNIAKWDGSS